MHLKNKLLLSIALTTSSALLTLPAITVAQNHDWPSYGGDNGSSKYSPLDQITADNVSELGIAWTWDSVDNATVANNIAEGNSSLVPAGYKGTPLVIDGTMYATTSFGRVVALDAASGEQLWVFDTESWRMGRPANLGFNTRGAAYWEGNGKQRLFFATNDSYLWSIDAETGEVDTAFGTDGRVDLTEGLRREINRRAYGVVSPPLVSNDKVIVNSIVNDGPGSIEMPPGDVRAFNPETGDVEWVFHTIPQPGEFGNDTWLEGSWEYTGNTNVWTIMSADDELGIVYLPVGTPTNDWYGGKRPGDNLFAESLVAVNVHTGERLWHFQTVHHGLWDYDLPAAPTLVDITVDGRAIKAVAQISNALGTVNPVVEIVRLSQAHGVPVLVDGAQAVGHEPVDVQALGCDFYALSGHKMYAPTGIGALYGRQRLLEAMPPWQGGGEMIRRVTFKVTEYNDLPHRFEAGTPHIAGAIGLGAAIDYLVELGMEHIARYEQVLLAYASQALCEVPGLRLIGTAHNRAAILSFVLEGTHPHDVSTILEKEGIAVRAGHHCAMPVMAHFGVPATTRASLALYNTRADIDALVQGLQVVKKTFA